MDTIKIQILRAVVGDQPAVLHGEDRAIDGQGIHGVVAAHFEHSYIFFADLLVIRTRYIQILIDKIDALCSAQVYQSVCVLDDRADEERFQSVLLVEDRPFSAILNAYA